MDGACQTKRSGLGIYLKPLDLPLIQQAIRCKFATTNNEAEYEALIAGLKVAYVSGARILWVKCDSQLVVNQVKGVYQARGEKMMQYLILVKHLMAKFPVIRLEQILREQNARADAMANLGALVKHDELEGPIVYIILQRSILEELRSVQNIEVADWRVPIVHYLLFDALPEDRHKARRLKVQAARFCLIDGKLFKRSIEGPYMKCLGPVESGEILEELHEGCAGIIQEVGVWLSSATERGIIG